jgi:hypothetical protein
MKKTLISILFLIFSSLHADNWQEYWVKAVENCETKNYKDAEEYFNAALGLIAKESIKDSYHVYVDRARLFLLLDRLEEGLMDVNIAIGQGKLSNQDMTRALVTRITILTKLNINPEVRLKDAKDLEKYDPNRPQEEITPDHIILRNIPDCGCYKKMMTNFFVGSGICEKESDVKILKSNIMIVKRKKCAKGVKCDCFNPKTGSRDAQETCEWYCDFTANAGHTYCAKTFKTNKCVAACCAAVDYIKKKCYWCCAGGEFYNNCIKPFEFILDYIKEPCDPYWD